MTKRSGREPYQSDRSGDREGICAELIRGRKAANPFGRSEPAELDKGTPSRSYDLEVIDIYQQPIFAKDGQIVARYPGQGISFAAEVYVDLSNTERVLAGLDLEVGKWTEQSALTCQNKKALSKKLLVKLKSYGSDGRGRRTLDAIRRRSRCVVILRAGGDQVIT